MNSAFRSVAGPQDPVALERHCLELLRRRPQDTEAMHGLGIAYLQQRRYAEADRWIAGALELDPHRAALLVNLGIARMNLGRVHQARDSFLAAIRLEPDLASAHINLANALRKLGAIDEAGAALETALRLQPDQAECLNNLANIRKEQGAIDQAIQLYQRALQQRPQFREAFSNLLAAIRLLPGVERARSFALHREFARRFEAPLKQFRQPHANGRQRDRRLRIGYLSPDCHPAASFFLRPIWRQHDRTHFDIHCYFDEPPDEADQAASEGLQQRQLGSVSDPDAARMIRDDGIDILIDIAGHAGRSRILVLALQPAPVQVTWLDYLDTTGLEAVQYRLSDWHCDPAGAEAFHSEHLVRFSGSQWCYPPPPDAPLVSRLPAAAGGVLTFGSFNNEIKLTAATLALWIRLLQELPVARLRFVGISSQRARERIASQFGAAGLAGRIEILPRLDYRSFLAACGSVDIGLDPIGFSGATTTCDLLWMGVPVLSLPGELPPSRSTASLMCSLGLATFVADSEAGYLAAAADWSRRPAELAQIRQELRPRMAASSLTDVVAFTAELEGHLRDMWCHWCGEQP